MYESCVCVFDSIISIIIITHTHTHTTPFFPAYEVNVSRIILNMPNMSQLAALFGVGLGLIFDPASRRTLFRRISRGSRYFFLFSAEAGIFFFRGSCFFFCFPPTLAHTNTATCVSHRHESSCHASRQI